MSRLSLALNVILKALFAFTLFSFQYSCSDSTQASLPKGHYEEDDQQASRGRGYPIVVPEYEASRALIVSWHLLQKLDKLPFLAQVLDSQELHVLVENKEALELSPGRLQLLKQHLESVLSPAQAQQRLDRVRFFSNDHKALKGAASWGKAIWARDYSPLTARNASGQMSFIDFNYYGHRPYEDATPYGYFDFRRKSSEILEASSTSDYGYVSVPVYNEGGNFMVGGNSHCVLSSAPLESNEDRKVTSDRILRQSDIEDNLMRKLGCRKVTILHPSLPYEKTKHIDLWAKFMGPNTVFVGQWKSSQERFVPDEHREKFHEMRIFLDEMVEEFSDYKVVRVPMPVPVFKENDKAIVRSYLNSLTLVSKGDSPRSMAYIPSYRVPHASILNDNGAVEALYPDNSLILAYEEEVAESYRRAGFEPFMVPADDLISQGGAIHCVTMQVP